MSCQTNHKGGDDMKDSFKPQRVLFAAALGLGVVGSVQAESTDIYGLVGLYMGSVKRSGETDSTQGMFGGGLKTSFIGFKGQEELGNGMKVLFSLESFFRPNTGEQGRISSDPLFSRNAWVGIEGGFGRVSLGRQTNPTYAVMTQLSPFGSSVVFSPLTVHSFVPAYGRNIQGDSVWNNAVKYATPKLGGFQGSMLYARNDTSGGSAKTNAGLHGTYRSGKLMAAVSLQRAQINGTTPLADTQRAWLAGATYDFEVVKLYGTTVHTDIDGGTSTQLYDLGASMPVSKSGKVLLETATTRIKPDSGSSSRRTTTSAGYDHQLSKRTDVFAIYSRDKKTAASAANSIAVGIRHLF